MLNDEQKARLEELRGKLLDDKGDYRQDANFDDLQELAKLEALADDQPVPKVAEPEKEAEKRVFKPKPESSAPKIVKPWLERGYDYYGVDKDGVHILYSKEEGMFYRLNKDPNFVDALGEGLEDEYLESLK